MNVPFYSCNKCNCPEKSSFLVNRKSITFSNLDENKTKENNIQNDNDNSTNLEIIEYPYSNFKENEKIPLNVNKINIKVEKNFCIFKEVIERQKLIKEHSIKKNNGKKDKDETNKNKNVLLNNLFKNLNYVKRKKIDLEEKEIDNLYYNKNTLTYKENNTHLIGLKVDYPNLESNTFLENSNNMDSELLNAEIKNNEIILKKKRETTIKENKKKQDKNNIKKNLNIVSVFKNESCSNCTLHTNKTFYNIKENILFKKKFNKQRNYAIINHSKTTKSIEDKKICLQNNLNNKECLKTIQINKKEKILELSNKKKIPTIENYKRLILNGKYNKLNNYKIINLKPINKSLRNKITLNFRKIDNNKVINHLNRTYINPFDSSNKKIITDRIQNSIKYKTTLN